MPGRLLHAKCGELREAAGAARGDVFDHDATVTLNALTCSGTSAFLKHGAGLLTLTGANTYTGTTVVEEGILALSGAGTLGTGGGLAVANGAICDLGGTVVYARKIPGGTVLIIR